MVSINEKLKQARLATNLTQEDLAEKLGVSRQTISNWENGRSFPDIVSIITLSDVYGINLDSLLKGDKEMIRHLKESTDTVKSNKRLIGFVIGLIAFGFFYIAGYFIRSFEPEPLIDDLVLHSLALVGISAAAFAAFKKSVDLIKYAEQKTSGKTLIVIGIAVLNAFVYASLIIFIPEFISSVLQTETEVLKAVIRVVIAGILFVPAYKIYKGSRSLFFTE